MFLFDLLLCLTQHVILPLIASLLGLTFYGHKNRNPKSSRLFKAKSMHAIMRHKES